MFDRSAKGDRVSDRVLVGETPHPFDQVFENAAGNAKLDRLINEDRLTEPNSRFAETQKLLSGVIHVGLE